jgi:hypothetical protein
MWDEKRVTGGLLIWPFSLFTYHHYQHNGKVGTMQCSFEVFAAVRFQVEMFWNVMPRSFVKGYERFGRSYCLHLQSEVEEMMSCSVAVWKH